MVAGAGLEMSLRWGEEVIILACGGTSWERKAAIVSREKVPVVW